MSQKSSHLERRERGFSLIEIMAVVVIIGLLMALVGSNIVGSLSQAEGAAAKMQIANLENAVEQYRMENRRYPTSPETAWRCGRFRRPGEH